MLFDDKKSVISQIMNGFLILMFLYFIGGVFLWALIAFPDFWIELLESIQGGEVIPQSSFFGLSAPLWVIEFFFVSYCLFTAFYILSRFFNPQKRKLCIILGLLMLFFLMIFS